MKRSDLLSSFTPSTMEPRTLEAIFVKREPLAQKIFGSIMHSATTGDREHHIAVGPRGIGKTHLLSLITFRLLADPIFVDRAVVAWLREEEWGIGSIGELFEAILTQLASEDTPIRAIHDHASAAVDRLATVPLDDLDAAAEHELTEVVGGRMLVVVVENLDLLFDSIGTDDQHRLRAYLQNERNTVLLASTPSLSESISQRSGLFFGFFAIHRLDELDVDEGRELLENIAALRDDEEGRRLTAYLQTDEATRRLQTVQDLVGGHPRLWVLMAECITTERLEEVVGLLLAVLDDLTPYYQAQMATLTPQQRKIVMVLSRAEGALRPKEIATRARVQERAVAKHLGDLTKLGYVRPAALPEGTSRRDGRSRPYELREPLLRHVLEVKESRGKPLRLIVRFLRSWYERPWLEVWSAADTPFASTYARSALADADDSGLATADIDLSTAAAFVEDGRLDEALIAFDQATSGRELSAQGLLMRAALLTRLGRAEDAADACRQATERDPSNVTAWIDLGATLEAIDDLDAALRATDRALHLEPEHALARLNRGSILARLGEHEAALPLLEQGVQDFPASPMPLVNLSIVHRHLAHAEESIDAALQAIDLAPGIAATHLALATALHDKGDHEGSLRSSARATSVEPENPSAHYNMAIALHRLGRYDDALAAYDRSIALDPTGSDAVWNRVLLRLEEFDRGPVAADIEQALRVSSPEVALRNLFWLLTLLAEEADQAKRDERLGHVLQASIEADRSSELLAVVVWTLTDARGDGRRSWAQTWSSLFRSAQMENPTSDLVHAIDEFLREGDGEVLARLPPEVRTIALDLLRAPSP